jgi:hypothetical protein
MTREEKLEYRNNLIRTLFAPAPNHCPPLEGHELTAVVLDLVEIAADESNYYDPATRDRAATAACRLMVAHGLVPVHVSESSYPPKK